MGFLPPEHHFAHSFRFFLHDLIVQTLVEGEKAGIFNLHVKDKDGKLVLGLTGKSGGELLDWMDGNGYSNEVVQLFYRQIFAGMLSDYGHFIYEALDCSRKAKLSVTYALLRKPLKQNLLYLEWLLANPDDLLKNFKDGRVDELDLDNQWKKRKEIVSGAMEKIHGAYWGPSDLVYQLRYDKHSENSFEAMWQQANHLVTRSPYKTAPSNFNFIFSNAEAKAFQWDFLYSFLPILLVHSYAVVEKLVKSFAMRSNEDADLTDFRVMCAYILWLRQYGDNVDGSHVGADLQKLLVEFPLSCPSCAGRFAFTDDDLIGFYGVGVLVCVSCKKGTNFF